MAVAARYLNRELFWVFVVVVVVLLTVAVGGRFIGYLQDAALGKYAAQGLLTIMWLRLPEFLQQLLPFAYYVALLLTVSRWHADREMTIVQNSGVGGGRLLRWLGIPAVLLAALVGLLSMVITPANNAILEDFFQEQRANEEFTAVSPGIFRTFARGNRVTYTESVSDDQRELQGVFMAERRPDRQDVTVWAESGRQVVDPDTGSRFLVLNNGTRYEGRIGDRNYRVVEFGALGQRLALQPAAQRSTEVESLPTRTLMGAGRPDEIAELHWRYSLPLLVLIATGIAVGLGRVKPRQGRFAKIVPGILVFVGYYVALVAVRNALEDGVWPPALGLWPVHLAFLGVCVALLTAASRPAKI